MTRSTAATKRLGTFDVAVAGIALVVASSTLVTDFHGYFALGATFAVALLLGFAVNLLLAVSAADLAVAWPRAGALYDYARAVLGGRRGAYVGVFLGLTFFGMFAFTASGETAAGALGLRALLGADLPVEVFVVVLSALAVIPNVLGTRTTAWVSCGLLLLMLGIRLFFGVAGFLGLGRTGPWSAANLDSGVGALDWWGDGGVIAAGFALAFWSFVGIEFACSLAEEVRDPRRALPRGLVLGLLGVLLTSLVMGLGVTGSAPLATWREAAASGWACGGEAPQLAVGQLMFGATGRWLMALASVAATLGTLTVAYAAMPRILHGIARDGRLLGPLGGPLSRTHPRFGTPVVAIGVTFAVYLVPALYSSAVVDWLYSAAYVWILLYLAFHALAILNRRLHPGAAKAFRGRWLVPAAACGIAATVAALYFAFAGSHVEYGGRALLVILAAAALTALSRVLEGASPGVRDRRRMSVPERRPALSLEQNHRLPCRSPR